MTPSRSNHSRSTFTLSPLQVPVMSSWQKVSRVVRTFLRTANFQSEKSVAPKFTLITTTHRDDVITLQNPHGITEPTALTGASSATVETKKDEKPKAERPKAVTETKKSIPCGFFLLAVIVSNVLSGNISPYSTGATGASLTSTSIDPQIQSTKLLWDEVKLSYLAYTPC